MTVTVASMGAQSRLAISVKETTYGTPIVPTTQLVFVSEGIGKHGNIVERDGLRGTRSHVSTDTRTGPYPVGGTLVLEPTYVDLVALLPFIMGADASGTSFALAETIPSFHMMVDRVLSTSAGASGSGVFSYPGCKVDRATFSGAPGGLMRLSLDIVAQDEGAVTSGGSFVDFTAGTSGTGFPTLTASVVTPFIFSDVVATFVGAARDIKSFELVIDNGLIKDRFMNRTTIANAPESDRIVTLTTVHPFATGNLDLYAQVLTGTTGTLKLDQVSPAVSILFTFGILQVPSNAPAVQGRGEIDMTLQMVARKTGSTPELATTLDSTP